MMLNFRRYILSLTVILAACAMQGCLDDTFNNYNTDYGDGVSDLKATVEFENLTPALHSRTAGDAIGAVSNLQMVIYRVTGEGTTEFYKRIVCSDLDDYALDDKGNSDEPADVNKNDTDDGKVNGDFSSTDEETAHADFTLNALPYGRYKIYAVANVPELSDEDCMPDDKFTSGEDHLKSMQFTWRSPLEGNGEVKDNDEMFGYFTLAEELNRVSTGFEAPIIAINRKTTAIHAWIKRLVSKVTIAFDPSGLEEAVTVYIKNVTIHDIPATCYLGKDNQANCAPGNPEKIKDPVEIIPDGEPIDYSNGSDDYDKWAIRLQKGSGIKGSDHSNTANALFFFENMQGDYQNQKDYLKVQIPEETGTSINMPGDNKYGDSPKTNDYKDRIPYGTYIEAEGYYVSKNTKKMSSGKIIYRFMLGKNITYNYDAQRNYHYKLTLKFRGWANEADWHISYQEDPISVYTPDTYYVSYLYGQDIHLPIRIVTGNKDAMEKYILKADIVVNDWFPWDEQNNTLVPWTIGNWNNINGFAWNKPAYDEIYKGENFAGFLSLRQPSAEDPYPNGASSDSNGYGKATNDLLRDYYNKENIAHAAYSLEETGGNGRYVCLYDTTNYVLKNGTESVGTYYVNYGDDGSATIQVPMYTRQKDLADPTDFTGNNPFPFFQRRAIVQFSLWDKSTRKRVTFKDINDKKTEVEYSFVPIMQVRRIENPKVIYRSHDSDAPFEIELMHQLSPGAKYTAVESDGPWRASVLTDPRGLVKLEGNGTTATKADGKYIEGVSGTTIKFTYTPSGTIDEDDCRCAIIQVEYHDYTCKHLIFVRQGYHKGVTLGNADWSCYQVYATGANAFTTNSPQFYTNDNGNGSGNNYNVKSVNVFVTRSPLSIGTFYKRNQYNYGFLESNNYGEFGWMQSVQNKDMNTICLTASGYTASSVTATTERKATWNAKMGMGWKSQGNANRANEEWADTWTPVIYTPGTLLTKKLTVPTADDYQSLTDNCEFGFGIAYADDAVGVATELEEVYYFKDTNNDGKADDDKGKGMRVCVAYNSSNGDNVLFPLGALGQGRRARAMFKYGGNNPTTPIPDGYKIFDDPDAGALSYSAGRNLLYGDGNLYRPLTYDLYRSAGSVYWIKKPVGTGGSSDYAGWDINYFNVRFQHYDEISLGGGSGYNGSNSSDALPIKLIYKK